MGFDLGRLAALWNEPPAAADEEARRAFGATTQDGRPVTIRVLDILTLTDGLVSEVWVVQQPLVTGG